MRSGEPRAVTWVMQRALNREPDLPPVEAWRTGLPALKASRLTAVAAHLLHPYSDSLPRDVRLHLEAAQLLGESLAEQSRLQIAEAAGLLNRVGIDWVALKGWALAARLYPSPAWRPSGDLDLLVAAGDGERAVIALKDVGYRLEGEDRSYHTRLVRPEQGQSVSVIELHHRTGPPHLGGSETSKVLGTRRKFESTAGVLWIPAPEEELDLLIRHYLRHAGYQAILLLDVLKLLQGASVTHPLGALVGDDLSRLGLERSVDGPSRLSQRVLRRWMGRRTFEQRRAARHAALVGIPLALSRSPGAALASLARLVWPSRPTPRWIESTQTRTGRYTWRLRRLVRLGR